MNGSIEALADALIAYGRLSETEYARLIAERTPGIERRLANEALRLRRRHFGDAVFTRGLIEITSFCKNNCLYCGIRRDNASAQRYRLTAQEILACAREGHALGFRTFVLQGGEDPFFTDDVLAPIVEALKAQFPDCAVTLSMGERTFESYCRLRSAGADRYLLRHETADRAHYARLHPPEMSFDNRLRCLRDLRALEYQVGCGFMVGAPGQTPGTLAKDLKFIETFRPEMCGIGPFIPHAATPFCAKKAGSVEETLFLLSVLRIIHPEMLIPATTALGTLDAMGREKGILCGANVVMPNLSPMEVRKKYALYDGKICTGDESAQNVRALEARMNAIGCTLATDRGDYPAANKVSAPEEEGAP